MNLPTIEPSISKVLADLPTIGLAELDVRAALRTRVDRKYLVDRGRLTAVIAEVGAGARVLDIGGRRDFGYESTYFDTPTFDSYLGAVRSRPDRFKVRLRRYVDADEIWLEVKTKDRRGCTVKHRVAWAPSDAAARAISGLGATGHRPFLSQFAVVHRHVDRLHAVIATTYRRTTIVLGETRATIDTDLVCTDGSDAHVGLADVVVLETKSARGAGDLDRALWSHGIRPTKISKFGVGMAALHPELPANKWHRTIDRHVTLDRAGLPGGPITRP